MNGMELIRHRRSVRTFDGKALKNEDAELLRNLEEEYGKDLSFRADPTIHIEDFKLIDPDSGREI